MFPPADIMKQSVGWWYISPRNGHLSVYTPAAIQNLVGPMGLNLASFNTGLHMLHRQPPHFARHLFPKPGSAPSTGQKQPA
jgi:hypothetical protein